MPVKNCEENGKPGFKYGDSGKCYTYDTNNEGSKRNAKKQAIIQGIAIGEFEVGVPHYTADGKLYEGPTHKDASGKLMTGATHTDDSEFLYHEDELPNIRK